MQNLASLMQYAPTVGGQFAGINQAQGEQMEQLRQQELAELIQSRMAEGQRKAAAHPLELESKRLANETSMAQLPGFQADSMKKQTDARIKAGTADSEIESTNTENKMKAYKAVGTQLGSISSELDGLPDIEKPRAFSEALGRIGLPSNVQESLMKRYGRLAPSEMVGRMQADAQRMLKENEAYVRTIEQERMQQEGANKRQGMQIQGQKDIEQLRIDAGKYNRNKTATDVQQALMKVRNAAQAAEILEQAYYAAEAANDMQMADQYKKRAMAARQRAAEDAGNRGLARPDVDPNQFGIGTNPRPAAVAPIAGAEQPAPQPGATPKQHSLADVSKMYPGIPPEKLREAYKKKFGVDLQ
jgi:hypothetical protein